MEFLVFQTGAAVRGLRAGRGSPLTVDPLGDSSEVLGNWLGRFGSHATWTAAAPRVEEVDTLAAFLRGAAASPDSHTSIAKASYQP